jgi:hypothetical protein
MQRGESWDDSDIKGAKKKEWNNSDKKEKSTCAAAPKPKTKKLFGLF